MLRSLPDGLGMSRFPRKPPLHVLNVGRWAASAVRFDPERRFGNVCSRAAVGVQVDIGQADRFTSTRPNDPNWLLAEPPPCLVMFSATFPR
jgi:hypothetical protein